MMKHCFSKIIRQVLPWTLLTPVALSLCAFGGCDAADSAASGDGDLLLVIDMQNAYSENGPWACPKTGTAADNIVSLIESGVFGHVIFTRFDAPENPEGTWKDYNEINKAVNEDEYLNDILKKLKHFTDVYPIYSKSTYSSFTIPEVQKAAEECMKNGHSVVVTGVVSECCVIATAFAAVDAGCPLIYITDACAGTNESLEGAVTDILSGLDYVQTSIMSTSEYLERARHQ